MEAGRKGIVSHLEKTGGRAGDGVGGDLVPGFEDPGMLC